MDLLVVVWAIENFRDFVYGTYFEVASDHKDQTTILRAKRSKKTFSFMFTRWVDRLLLFQFKVEHAPGRTKRRADYLSRPPSENNNNEQKIKAEELWDNSFSNNEVIRNLFQQNRSHSQTAIS